MNMTITRAYLVDQVHKEHSQLTRIECVGAVESFLSIAKATLIGGNNLLLSNFGKFSVKSKRQRKGRNPQTGESILLQPRKVIVFKESGMLKERLNAPFA